MIAEFRWYVIIYVWSVDEMSLHTVGESAAEIWHFSTNMSSEMLAICVDTTKGLDDLIKLSSDCVLINYGYSQSILAHKKAPG